MGPKVGFLSINVRYTKITQTTRAARVVDGKILGLGGITITQLIATTMTNWLERHRASRKWPNKVLGKTRDLFWYEKDVFRYVGTRVREMRKEGVKFAG